MWSGRGQHIPIGILTMPAVGDQVEAVKLDLLNFSLVSRSCNTYCHENQIIHHCLFIVPISSVGAESILILVQDSG